MKLKDRFRKALFAFFKEEIINSVKAAGADPFFFPDNPNKYIPIRMDLDYKQINIELDLSDEDAQYSHFGLDRHFEIKLHDARKALFSEFIKFIRVESYELFDIRFYRKRRLKFSVWVGKEK